MKTPIAGQPISIRALAPSDCLSELTALLHKAYASLGAQGWNFTGVDQSVEVTAKRVMAGHCLVALHGETMVGTVMVRGPYRPGVDAWYLDTPWYTRADTAILSQFAVDPQCQGQGLGARLMQAAEAWAGAQGMAHVALDTARPAEHLQRRYAGSGYVPMCEIQWEGKNYASVLMVKTLAPQLASRS
ncbi:GNAT family N-acetyltransferase [Paucibacter sp. B2R-40]|uniref:GNAT family N-acetyltransferase n=1 Tax=Paucibacter sp. B2R-40 TaxID=2893554 RepID=UPI0021E4F86F|nr:GNAT family N-acetyltransferase [Paucibacter sp. B2R-40]MCV2356989.1 GNAT family N-acetyltransferase [Paucibacter sp. B2R-40]